MVARLCEWQSSRECGTLLFCAKVPKKKKGEHHIKSGEILGYRCGLVRLCCGRLSQPFKSPRVLKPSWRATVFVLHIGLQGSVAWMVHSSQKMNLDRRL